MNNCQDHQSKHIGCRAYDSGPVPPPTYDLRDALRRMASDGSFVLAPDGTLVAPTVAPWRSRALTDVLALALIRSNATDAQAADHYSLRCAGLERDLMRLRERTVVPMRVVEMPGYTKSSVRLAEAFSIADLPSPPLPTCRHCGKHPVVSTAANYCSLECHFAAAREADK